MPEGAPARIADSLLLDALIRAGAWNAYVPVLSPGRLLQLGGCALRL